MDEKKKRKDTPNSAQPLGGITFATNKACKDCVFAFAQGKHDPLNGTCDMFYSKPYEVAYEGKPCEHFRNAKETFDRLEKQLSLGNSPQTNPT